MLDVNILELMAQVALSFAFFGLWIILQWVADRHVDLLRRRALNTALFTLAGVLTLTIAHSVLSGVILDQRGAIIGLATVRAGLPGGAITAVACAAMRLWLGGPGAMAGVAGIAADLAVAWAVAALVWRRSDWPAMVKLAVLGAAVGVTEAASLMLVPDAGGNGSIALTYGDDLFLVQVAGTLLFGGLIEIDEERRALRSAQEDRLRTLSRVVRQTVDAFATATAYADQYTAGHETRVATLAVAIGRRMALDDDRLEGLETAAKAHDVGQMVVPPEILLRPRRLTPLEFAFVKRHPEVGWEILHSIDFPWPVAEIVRQHHENFDGTGYPRGLSGEDILLEARILRVADVCESLHSHRPYRSALAEEEVIALMTAMRGKALDPVIVDHCLGLMLEDGYRFATADPLVAEPQI